MNYNELINQLKLINTKKCISNIKFTALKCFDYSVCNKNEENVFFV
jgi:hypothetical protein